MKPTQIKRLRKRLGLTQVEFAKALSVSFATVNRWENGHNSPLPLMEKEMKRLVANGGLPESG